MRTIKEVQYNNMINKNNKGVNNIVNINVFF